MYRWRATKIRNRGDQRAPMKKITYLKVSSGRRAGAASPSLGNPSMRGDRAPTFDSDFEALRRMRTVAVHSWRSDLGSCNRFFGSARRRARTCAAFYDSILGDEPRRFRRVPFAFHPFCRVAPTLVLG